MKLIILAASALGVLLLVGLNMLLTGWRRPTLGTPADAEARFRTDFFDAPVRAILLDADGAGALLALSDSPDIGLVTRLGDRWVTRRFGPGDLRVTDLSDAGPPFTLRVGTAGTPAERFSLHIDDAETAARWWHHLDQLTRSAGLPAAERETEHEPAS